MGNLKTAFQYSEMMLTTVNYTGDPNLGHPTLQPTIFKISLNVHYICGSLMFSVLNHTFERKAWTV